jgi:hypothetical protein
VPSIPKIKIDNRKIDQAPVPPKVPNSNKRKYPAGWVIISPKHVLEWEEQEKREKKKKTQLLNVALLWLH